MAKLRYINQFSKDTQQLIHFYKDIIGLKVEKPGSDWYGFTGATTQFAIEPQSNRDSNIAKYKANWGTPYLLQIEVESEEEMQEILNRAKKNNVKVLAEFEKHSFGTLSKLLDPDSNFVELILQ